MSREGERERTADDVSKGALDIETGSGSLARDEPGGYLSTAQVVSGMEAARAWFWLWCGTREPVALTTMAGLGVPAQPFGMIGQRIRLGPVIRRKSPKQPKLQGVEYRCGAQGRAAS